MSRLARSLVRVAGALVPRSERREWREEWLSELAALERHGADGTPGPVSFALGAFAHALTLRRTSWSWTGLGQDLRWARRSLVRAPGFALGAALTLALGIGANATIFALINGLLLRPPPGLTEPERLVQVARSYEQDPRFDNFSWPAFEVIADETAVFASVGASNQAAFVLGTGDDVEQVPGLYVTGSWFGTLGVRPAVGRLLQPADDRAPGAHPVVVLSHALWTRRFGADPRVVGRTVTIGGEPYEIVGVAAQEFAGTEALGAGPQVWLPAMQTPPMGDRLPFDEWGWSSFDVVARLADGVDLEAASAAMPGLAARLRAAAPVNDGILVLLAEGVGLDPEERAEARRLSGILLLVVGLLLLITCTNVANLFLARAGARQAELGVRAALGAGSGRLARQLLVESLVLAGLATVLALPLVLRAGAVLPALFPWTLSVPVGVDARVLVFLAAVGLATGLFFGAMPAWVTSRRSLAGILRDAGPTSGRRTTRIRDALVVAQLGLSLGLVTGAALLGRSVWNARAADPGFRPDGLHAAVLALDRTGRYDDTSGLALYARLLDEAAGMPGVEGVTLANQMPIAGGHSRQTVRPQQDPALAYEAEYTVVAGDYFTTLDIPILRGRALRGIGREPEPVVVVNEALASMFWPGEDPIGKVLAGEPAARVVGLVPDVQMRSLRAPGRPAVYWPIEQRYSPFVALHLRTADGASLTAGDLRALVRRVDPELPAPVVIDLRAAVRDSLAETRTLGLLLATFAGLALLLATIGLYGLVSFQAAQRVREIGIRAALGARPLSLTRLVVRRGLILAGAGALGGLLASWALGHALQSLLYDVDAQDPWTAAAAALVLLVTAVAAAWIPARRAGRVDALVALRS